MRPRRERLNRDMKRAITQPNGVSSRNPAIPRRPHARIRKRPHRCDRSKLIRRRPPCRRAAMSNHRARASRLIPRLFIRASGTAGTEMRRLLSIPRPESKAILKTVRVQAEAEAAVVAAEAAVRVEVKAGMIRVRAVMIARAAITNIVLLRL